MFPSIKFYKRVLGLLTALFLFSAARINAQIYTYTNDTGGAYSTVATHATGTALSRVNGATRPGTICSHGFSSKSFTTATSYASTLPGVKFTVSPASGYTLNITGFSVGIRSSSTGPADVMFAYSLDGGTTWISEGTPKVPNITATCDSTITATWTTSITVSSTTGLVFGIFGYNASGTTGTFQVLNLTVNGSVGLGCTAPTLSDAVTNVACFGGHTGSVTVTATGGSSPYTYLWSTGATTSSVSGLAAGTYLCTVTATGGCTASISATVTQPSSALSAIIGSVTSATCSSSTGSATVTASGGTSPYTYAWSTTPVATSATATGLAPGSYSVTVTDAHGCTATATTTVSTATLVAPTSLSVTGITSSGAELHWAPVAGAASYNIEYRHSGTTTWSTTTSTVDSVALTGLGYAYTYQFQVQAVCSGGTTSSYSTMDSFTTLTCLYPSGITVSSITSTSAVISWTGVSGATSYTIGYRISGTTTWHDTTVTVTTCTLTGLTDTTTYNYDVQTTCTGGGTSAFSTVSNFTTLNAPACGIPTALAVSSVTSSSAILSWTGVTGATSYSIKYRTTAGTTWTTVTSTTTSYTLTGLAAGTGYLYEVAAICPSGTSAYSSYITFVTLSCIVPSSPTSASVTSSSAIVSWSASPGAVSYTLGYRVSGTTTWHDTTVTGTSVTLTGLLTSTTYQYEVETVCSGGGTSPWSSTYTFTTLTTTGACGVPSGLTASSLTSSSAVLSWTAAAGAVSYKLKYKTAAGTSTSWITISTTSTSYTLTGLSYATTYDYEVEAICSTDTSVYSSASTFTTLTCLYPTSVTVGSITSSSAVISFTGATGAISYTLGYHTSGSTSWTDVAVTSSPYTLTGLSADSTYVFDLKTTCTGGGTSSWTSTSSFTTTASGTTSCGTPTGMTTSSITSTSAVLSWTAVTGAVSYNIQYRVLGATTWSTTTATSTSVTLTGLSASTTYEFQVQTVCSGSSTSSFSGSTNFSTTGSCGVPTGLTAGTITTTTAVVSWTAVTGATSYNVRYAVSGSTSWTTTTSTTTSATLTGLTAGITYQYEVQAVCSSGTSGYSSPGTFVTPTVVSTTGCFTYLFNQPVDTSVRTGTPATYLNNCMADTLCAYINRAHYSIDIAQYEYLSGAYANIATAINNAYARGVKVRWIYDSSTSQTGMATLVSGIHTMGSPIGSAYGIMHNKFVIFDAKSPNPADQKVWTGSVDWTSEEFSSDFNNIVVVQDSGLAHAFLAEFNMMWGDTGIAPNWTTSKFGTFKTDLGRHSFTICGKTVELYFSPSDGANTHVESAINSANTDLYFGMYTYSYATYATDIMARHTAGVYVAGIDDVYSNPYTPHTTFTSGLGSMFKVYSPTGTTASVYHNKFLIVDPSNTCSDPLVETGSMNWSTSGYNLNDENILIIHDATAANIYYQSFYKNFTSLGGSLTHVSGGSGCSTVYLREGENGESAIFNSDDNTHVAIYPNPTDNQFTIAYNLSISQNVTITVADYMGREVTTIVSNEKQEAGSHEFSVVPSGRGMYFVRITIGNQIYVGKVTKL